MAEHNNMTPMEAAAFLKAHDRYLILTHVRPDGDTIGCAAGLCRALRQMGKEAFVLHNPEDKTVREKGLAVGHP